MNALARMLKIQPRQAKPSMQPPSSSSGTRRRHLTPAPFLPHSPRPLTPLLALSSLFSFIPYLLEGGCRSSEEHFATGGCLRDLHVALSLPGRATRPRHPSLQTIPRTSLYVSRAAPRREPNATRVGPCARELQCPPRRQRENEGKRERKRSKCHPAFLGIPDPIQSS